MLKFSKCEKWDNAHHIIHYDPQEAQREGQEKAFEYTKFVIVPAVNKGAVVEALLREKYTLNDELALLRQRTTKKAEFNEYNDFAEACKVLADQILAALDE